MSFMLRLVVLPLVVIGLSVAAFAQPHQHTGEPTALGTVSFDTSCNADAQQSINRAMAMLHSFWYEEAQKLFADAAAKDPSCAIAHWGVAVANWQPLWEVRGPGPAALERGRSAVERAKTAASASEREREYVAAIAKFYTGAGTVDHLDRVKAYEQAMQALQEKYPQDTEAKVLYALALLGSAASHPPDKTYARQRRAGELLQPVFRDKPDHPGVAHYIIHAYDYPSLAADALEAARRYAKIAPDSPHALHMPSHIFVRRGFWDEAIGSNRAVAEAARKHGIFGEELHGRDYWVFAHLQQGEDAQARKVIDDATPMRQVSPTHTSYFAGLYASAAMPARYAVERRQWAEAAALRLPADFPGGRYAWADAAIYFARALGAARSDRLDQARRDLAKLGELQKTLVEHKEDYWANQVEIQRTAAEAWLLLAEGKHDAALDTARRAADMEAKTDKHPVTPGQIVPARDLLGQMLLELKRQAEALAEFQKVIEAEPNRFSPLYGAGRAAEMAGDMEKARQYYEQIVELAPSSTRPEVKHARDIVKGASR